MQEVQDTAKALKQNLPFSYTDFENPRNEIAARGFFRQKI